MASMVSEREAQNEMEQGWRRMILEDEDAGEKDQLEKRDATCDSHPVTDEDGTGGL